MSSKECELGTVCMLLRFGYIALADKLKFTHLTSPGLLLFLNKHSVTNALEYFEWFYDFRSYFNIHCC